MLATAAIVLALSLLAAEVLYRRAEVRRALARCAELAPHDLSAARAVHARAARLARPLPHRVFTPDEVVLLELGPLALLEPGPVVARFGTRHGPTVRQLGAGDPLDLIATRRFRRTT